MSNKQLGAAPGENPKPPSAPGRFSRLRALPGFRAAATAFVLTVILGAGVPAAYAYWSQSTALTVTGTTPRPVTPVPAATCAKTTPVTIKWQPDSTADKEIRYIVTLEASAAGISAAYALPAGTPDVWSVDPLALYMLNPKALTVQTAGSSGIEVTATVRSVIAKPGLPATATIPVMNGYLAYASAPATVKMNLTVASPISGKLACV